MPTFSVRMFAYLKDRHGDIVRIEAEPSLEAVLEALRAEGVKTQSCRLSVNLEFPEGNVAIGDRDELALIPPVSGG